MGPNAKLTSPSVVATAAAVDAPRDQPTGATVTAHA